MKPRTGLGPALVTLTEKQAGVVSRDQLLRSGLHRRSIARMLATGSLVVITPGIYARFREVGWLGKAWAGILLGGGSAVLGGASAGFLEGLVREEPAEITVYTTRQLAWRDGFRFIRGKRACRGEPARTKYEATVIDMCVDRSPDELAALLSDAVSSRKTTTKRLLAELNSRQRIPHRSLLREMLGDVATGAHSALERRYLIHVERAHGLPTAQRQAHAGTKYRTDAWYDSYGVVAELDSKLYHLGAAGLRDMQRDNAHALAGNTTFRFGWHDVTGSAACLTARFMASALQERGWQGVPTPCQHCDRVHPV